MGCAHSGIGCGVTVKRGNNLASARAAVTVQSVVVIAGFSSKRLKDSVTTGGCADRFGSGGGALAAPEEFSLAFVASVSGNGVSIIASAGTGLGADHDAVAAVGLAAGDVVGEGAELALLALEVACCGIAAIGDSTDRVNKGAGFGLVG